MAFGSNMGDSISTLEKALDRLGKDRRLSLEKVSSFYRTKAWGKTDQPDFINGAALISWEGTAEELMTLLLTVEKEFGRKRDVHWGPRTLDLDLIYSEGITRNTDFLHLPGKRKIFLFRQIFFTQDQSFRMQLADTGNLFCKRTGTEMAVCYGNKISIHRYNHS